MYILDTKYFVKQGMVYLIVSLLCLIFGGIYELFSHGVYSNYMIFSFLIPLIFGAVISFIICLIKAKPERIGNNLYNAGIATLTFGCIFNGVLEIYGTTNWKIYIYLVVGITLILAGLGRFAIRLNKKI